MKPKRYPYSGNKKELAKPVQFKNPYELYEGKDGKIHSNVTTVWAQLGRRFLYDKLKAIGVLPTIEQ